MLAQTRLKLKNAESSIAFIQEQHAKTLAGLHEEIKRLQKKNARLNFDLAMMAPPDSKDSSKCGGCTQLENELVVSKSEVLQLSSALSSASDNEELLKHQMKDLESKYTSDVNSRDEMIQSLTIELERKSNTVALITQQYHQLRARFHQELDSFTQTNVCPHCHCYDNNTVDDTDGAAFEPSELQRTQYQFRGLKLTPNLPSGISRRPPAMIQRRNFQRTTSSPIPFQVSSMTSIDSSGSTQVLPTPPLSPKPLSYSSSPPQLRRASKPLRTRQLGNSSTATHSTKQSLLSQQQFIRKDSSDGSQANTPLEPVKRQKSGTLPIDIDDIIQLNRSQRQKTLSMKQPPPILPPIKLNEHSTQSNPMLTQALTMSSSNIQATPPSLQATPPITSRQQHRRFILSKAQGLSSAPVRPMRVVCYNQARLKAMEMAKEEMMAEGLEGTLLVSETEGNWNELHHQGTDR